MRTLNHLADRLDRGGDATDRYRSAYTQYFPALTRHAVREEFQVRHRLIKEAVGNSANVNFGIGYGTSANFRLVTLMALRREAEAAIGN